MQNRRAVVRDASSVQVLAPEMEWSRLFAEMRLLAPEAFDRAGNVLNLIDGRWGEPGKPRDYHSPVDGRLLGRMPMIDLPTAREAVRKAAARSEEWARTDLDERRRRVTDCLAALRANEGLIARLLMWEIGKPWAQAKTDVERCISGVEWYVGAIEPMLQGRKPLGLISNIASWNYPLSVLVHAVLVQVLAGNTVIAKTPTDGGMYAITVAMALAHRAGLPVSLVSGSGGQLSEALVRGPEVACLAFVGGKANGRDIAENLENVGKRYMLEMEGVNAYGVWDYSDWDALGDQIRRGFDYGKQRCTAYVRWVVQRRLFPRFLETYLEALESLRFGHPMAVPRAGDPLPKLDFGPLINAAKVKELHEKVDDAIAGGAVPLHLAKLDPARFLPGQDTSAYFAPVSLLSVPRGSRLYAAEPFGPVDTLVLVDSTDHLVAEMNVSNGALVASLATDDKALAKRLLPELRAFKVGHNVMRSRGDRAESFGGVGQSWKGSFVGGRYLVEAVTEGPAGERHFGNFPGAELLPEDR